MGQKIISLILVIVQISCLIILFGTGPSLADPLPLLLLEIIALVIGFWGIITMRKSRLNVFPDVLKGSSLISSGPYKLIRHPMYLSLFLLSISLLLTESNTLRIIIVIILCINLLFKVEFEEKLLKKKFPGYKDYASRTWKIFPYLY